MADEDLFKRYLELGASILGMTRERAESIVRDLVASGEVARGQATKAADWLVERGRAGTEELTELVRREIRQQVSALGLATKEDIARLETQIGELRGPTAAPAAKKPPARKSPAERAATKTAPGTKPAGISRAASVRKRAGGSPPAGGTVPPKG